MSRIHNKLTLNEIARIERADDLLKLSITDISNIHKRTKAQITSILASEKNGKVYTHRRNYFYDYDNDQSSDYFPSESEGESESESEGESESESDDDAVPRNIIVDFESVCSDEHTINSGYTTESESDDDSWFDLTSGPSKTSRIKK